MSNETNNTAETVCVSFKLKGPSLKVVNEQLAATLQDISKSLEKSWFCLGASTLTWISNITVLFGLIPRLNADVSLLSVHFGAVGSGLEQKGQRINSTNALAPQAPT